MGGVSEILGLIALGLFMTGVYYVIGFLWRAQPGKQVDRFLRDLRVNANVEIRDGVIERYALRARGMQLGFALGGGIGIVASIKFDEASGLDTGGGGLTVPFAAGILGAALTAFRAEPAAGPRMSALAPRGLRDYVPVRETVMLIVITTVGMVAAVAATARLLAGGSDPRLSWAVAAVGALTGILGVAAPCSSAYCCGGRNAQRRAPRRSSTTCHSRSAFAT